MPYKKVLTPDVAMPRPSNGRGRGDSEYNRRTDTAEDAQGFRGDEASDSESDRDSIAPRRKSSSKKRRERSPSQESSSDEQGSFLQSAAKDSTKRSSNSVLSGRALQVRQENRYLNAQNMSSGRRSVGKKDQKDGGADDELRRKLEAAEAKLKAAEKENLALKTQKGGKKHAQSAEGFIPVCYEAEVFEYTLTTIWRDVKFISSKKDMPAICRKIMANLPEFSGFLEGDPIEVNENISAFRKIYSGCINRAINKKRTNVIGTIKKKFESLYIKTGKMPTIKALRGVILRVNLQIVPVPKDADEATKSKIEADNAKARANISLFAWYWKELLPCVAGKHRWGHGIRNAVIISKGRKPSINGLGEKYISASDEAFVLVVLENYYKRFKYTAECKKNNMAVDQKDPKYECRWTDDKAGQQEFGGWDQAGTNRFAALYTNIVNEKKKDHVVAVETTTLAHIRGAELEDLTGEDDEMLSEDEEESGETGDVARAKTSFIDVDSDAESVEVVEMDDLDDNFTNPKAKKARRKR